MVSKVLKTDQGLYTSSDNVFFSLFFSIFYPLLFHLLTQVPLWRRCSMMRMIYYLRLVSFLLLPIFSSRNISIFFLPQSGIG
jgi:hypothetical protein